MPENDEATRNQTASCHPVFGSRIEPHRYSMLDQEPVATIEREELKEKLDSGKSIKLVMALNRWAFDNKHIPGSIHFDSLNEAHSSLQKDEEIVVYCSNVDCLASVALYRDLVANGYRKVRRYAGGLMDWEEAGLTLEGDAV